MMTNLLRRWLGVLAVLATPALAAGQPAVVFNAPGQVKLGLQQQAVQKSPALTIHFSGYRDERCPADVQCVWAGEAQAFFWVTGPGFEPQALVLPWSGAGLMDRGAKRLGNYRFALVSLEPRPLANGAVNPADYTAVLAVDVMPASPAR